MGSNEGGEQSATLVVERVSDRDVKMRILHVMVDGKPVTDLYYGDTREFKVPVGHHVLKVSNSLYSREMEIDLAPGSTTKFSAGNIMRGLGALMIVAFGIGPYNVFLERSSAA